MQQQQASDTKYAWHPMPAHLSSLADWRQQESLCSQIMHSGELRRCHEADRQMNTLTDTGNITRQTDRHPVTQNCYVP